MKLHIRLLTAFSVANVESSAEWVAPPGCLHMINWCWGGGGFSLKKC